VIVAAPPVVRWRWWRGIRLGLAAAAFVPVPLFGGKAAHPATAVAGQVTPTGTAAAFGAPGARGGPMPGDPSRRARYEWEPQVAEGPGGVLWAVGDSCGEIVQEGLCQLDMADLPRQPDAVMLWRSTDGGRQWQFVADPMRLPGGLADRPAGYDVDVAVSPPERPGRAALLSVVANWGGSTELAVSADNGRNWVTSLLDGFVGTGRPWLAAVGPCQLAVAFDPLTGDTAETASVPLVARYDVCSFLAGALVGQGVAVPESVTTVDPATDEVTRTDDVFSKLRAIGADLYEAMVVCDSSSLLDLTTLADPSCDGPGDRQTVQVAESTDGGRRFHDVVVATGTFRIDLADGTWPLSFAVDRHGLAVLVADTGFTILTFVSHDGARTWQQVPSVADPLHWGLAGVPSAAVAGDTYAVGWYASPPAPAGQRQAWYLATAVGQGSRPPTVRVLPTELATTNPGQPLLDTLSESFGAALVAHHAVFVFVESCSDNPPAAAACPEPPTGLGRQLVVRWAWLPPPQA